MESPLEAAGLTNHCLWSQEEDESWNTEFRHTEDKETDNQGGVFINAYYQWYIARLIEAMRYIIQQTIQQRDAHIKL